MIKLKRKGPSSDLIIAQDKRVLKNIMPNLSHEEMNLRWRHLSDAHRKHANYYLFQVGAS